MVQQQPNGGPDNVAVTLAPWQLAEIRRQLYIDLRELAEHIAEEAERASQMNTDDPGQKLLGVDLRAFVHRSFADAVSLLDAIGWDVDGDTALLIAHGHETEA